MMNQIQMWQLFVDIGLITSVLAMTMKAFKSSRIPSMLPRTRELEASLKALINEAEQAGLQLNDQLLRREQNIQKALSEIQGSEARMSKAISEAEELQTKLQTTRSETVRLIQDLKAGFELGMQSEQVRHAEELNIHRSQAAPVASPASPRLSESIEVQVSQPHKMVEPQSTEFVEQVYADRAPTPRQQSSVLAQTNPLELKRVYESVEVMIKGGQALESIASQMKLPIDGVKRLAQMIEIEREEDSRQQQSSSKTATTDSRLGALALGRRQTSTL